jgi:type VI secretion system ImpM family protein
MTTQYLAAGCFGKLPCYTEYLEENIAYPTSRALKNWIHEGRAEARMVGGAGEAEEAHETLHRRFVYGIPGSVELAVGVIRPSTDQGGHRRFPFMLVTHIPRRHGGKHYSMLPLALEPVWDALDDAWENLASLETHSAFKELLGSTLIPAPPPIDEVRSTYDLLLGESSGRVFSGHEGAGPSALKRNFPEFLRRLGKGGETPALEVPVSGDLAEACADTAFWLEAVNRQTFWKRFEPSMFIEGASQKKNRHVFMVFGIIRPQDYAPILGCGEGGGGIVRPALVSDQAAATDDLAPQDGPSFGDLLKGISGH